MSAPLGTASLSKPDLQHLGESFRAGRMCFVQSLPVSAQAFLAWNLLRHFQRPVAWVCDSPKTLDVFHQDLSALAGPDELAHLAFFPAREDTVAGRPGAPHPDLVGDRLRTLQQSLAQTAPLLVATCIQALLQPVPPPDAMARDSRRLELNQETDLDPLIAFLEHNGYQFEPEVLQKGQAALRGGLLDVWPPTEAWPLRLEFFGPVLDALRTFDPVGQRSLEKRTSLVIPPATEALAANPAESVRLTAYLPPQTLWGWAEPDSIDQHAEMFQAAQSTPGAENHQNLLLQIERSFTGGQVAVGPHSGREAPAHRLDLQACEGLPDLSKALHPDLLDETRRLLVRRLARQTAEAHFFFNTEGSRDRFLELYREEIQDQQSVHLHLHPLSEGFTLHARQFAVVAESDLYGFRKQLPGRYERRGRKTGPTRVAGERIAEWSDLQPGELVVHLDHGIGKYLGLYQIEFDGREQEALAVEYADTAKLYVPVSQAHLLSRYVSVGRLRPTLHTLGGKRWTREKLAAEQAVRDMASSLIETQARRDALDGHAFSPDTPWQHEFEASFPFAETEDQHQAILATKADMESRRPMDRLVCGDVGYGKTEVAMRAAFKAVMDGRQVAVLVPTTILAQQHADTFAERMAAYPVTVDMLSRFRTHAQQRETLRRLSDGSLDIVIGTHRLVQADVRFHNLGLVIIDEEQRFGVEHKERLKRFCELVDVLTLTATPIPRTLYMSLTGARDMSTIQTPPQDRLPVETIVAQNTDAIVREAILRELNRGGQVFYLHNRVMSIQTVWERLRKIVPEARIAVGHGQMHEKELSEVMHQFMRGDFDVLLCTTIIESGVDIPNVNTILIDRADRFGMAELYQLRGRVGRYKHQAYAYLLLPRHGRLFDTARKRITAIQRYSGLGAGFKLALRDLEIRGAGNLLGAQQSGHIAAIGFDLYCQLLRRTVARLKNEAAPPLIEAEVKLDFLDLSPQAAEAARAAVIPHAYIEDENLRIQMYRKISSCTSETEVQDLLEEARDRFGPVPEPLRRLLDVAHLRILASSRNLQGVETQEDKVLLHRQGDYVTLAGKLPRMNTRGASERLKELLALVGTLPASLQTPQAEIESGKRPETHSQDRA